MFSLFFPLLLFFLDFLLFNILQKWLIFSLLWYFIIQLLVKESNPPFGFKSFYFPFFLFLLQDNFINGRVGVCLIYIVPMIFLTTKIKNWFDPAIKFIYWLFIFFTIFLQDFLIKNWLLGQNIAIYSTISKIFINIIVVYLVFLGMRGSRSLLNF